LFAHVKAISNKVGTGGLNGNAFHSGSGNWELLSQVAISPGFSVGVYDTSTSGWTPIEVDYIGAINITDLVSRGILPSGLTNAQYKDILDV